MWHFVVWGVLGAVAHRANAFMEVNASRRKWPLRSPEGPDGKYYLAACAVHCFLAGVVTAAAASGGQVTTVWHALFLGAATPSVLAKFTRYALRDAPPAVGECEDDQTGAAV